MITDVTVSKLRRVANGCDRRVIGHVGDFDRIEGISLAVVVVLDGVVVLIDRPLCVQVVRSVIVDAGIVACRECIARAVVLRVPAGERVALASGKIGLFVGLDRDLLIVRVCGKSLGLIVEAAVVGDGDRLRCLVVNGGQGDITVDRDLAVRVVRLAIAVHPIEEDLVIGGGARTVEDGGGCVLAVAVVVGNRSAVAARGIIGHFVAGLAAELGSQDEVAGDLGFRVERLAVFIDPAEELLALGGRGGCGKGDGGLVRNVLFHIMLLTVGHEGDLMHRRGPVGVNGDVLRGHGLAVEDERLRARGVSVPAGEVIRCVDALGSRRRVASGIGDGGLELVRLLFHRLAIVHIDHVAAIAVVVEFGVVVIVLPPASTLGSIFVKRETGDVIIVFLRDLKVRSHRGIFVVKLVVLAIIFLYVFIIFMAGENLHIIISSLCYRACLGTIEVSTTQRHRLDTGLTGRAVRLYFPSATAVNGRPLIADVSAVLGGDGLKQIAGFIMASQVTADPLDRVELHLILVALVFHVDDGGAVACDGLLRDRQRGEAIIRLGRGCGLGIGSAELRLGFHVGIVVIVGVFLPVDHGVVDTLHGLPLGGQRDVRSKLATEGELGIAILPVSEGVACSGRVGGLRGLVSYELRRYVGAAFGFKVDPMALLHLGVEVDVFRTERNGIDLVFGRIGLVRIPAGDGLIRLMGEGNVLKGDFVARRTFLGLNDIAIFAIFAGRVEVDVVYFLELRIEPYGLALGDAALFTESGERGVVFIVPSGETMPLFLGRCRLQQRITVLDDLLFAVQCPIYVELVGEVLVNVRPDDLCRHRGGRQHVQRQQAQRHHEDQDPGEKALANFLLRHKKILLFLPVRREEGGR